MSLECLLTQTAVASIIP